MAGLVLAGRHLQSRVDLFLDKNSGEFYFNEVNTIPGFTEISQYPILCGNHLFEQWRYLVLLEPGILM